MCLVGVADIAADDVFIFAAYVPVPLVIAQGDFGKTSRISKETIFAEPKHKSVTGVYGDVCT